MSFSKDHFPIFSGGHIAQRDRVGKSMRVPFPRQYSVSDVDEFVSKVKDLLEAKVDLIRIVRLGLCAISFQDISKNGIGSFFQQKAPFVRKPDSKSAPPGQCESQINNVYFRTKNTFDFGSQHMKGVAKRAKGSIENSSIEVTDAEHITTKAVLGQEIGTAEKGDADLQYAQKLQALYDRENSVLSSSSNGANKGKSSGKSKIENFFLKRK